MVRASLLLMLACALVGCKSLPPATPLSQLNEQQLHGHDVFETHCGSCHYDRREGGLHGPSLLGVFRQPSLPSGAPANDERVTATIEDGRGLMPAVGKSMDQQEMKDLLAYLHTL